MKSTKIILERIEKKQGLLHTKQMALIQKLEYHSFIDFLFELSVLFEMYYAREKSTKPLQSGTKCLSHLILRVIKSKTFSNSNPKTVEEIQQQVLGDFLIQIEQGKENPVLQQLYHSFEEINFLEELRQIEKYDRSCEVVFAEDGRFYTKLISLNGLKYDIKTGLKYQQLIDYYGRLGFLSAQHSTDKGELSLQGKNEVDRIASRIHHESKIATQQYLDYFGIEEQFCFQGETYSTRLLIDILSLLIVWSQVRYGILLEEHLPNKSIRYAVLGAIVDFGQGDGREIPGPLVFSTWEELVERVHQVFYPAFLKREIAQHLNFYVQQLSSELESLDLHQTPLLKMGSIVAFFLRPLMMQNSWMPIINRLIGNKGNADERKRVTRSADRLAKMFREHGFNTLVDHKLTTAKDDITDIDLAVIKENHLFLIQLKMTAPKPSYEDMKSHIEDALRTANRQCRKVYSYLMENWVSFRYHFHTDLEWSELKVQSLIVSTSFERDRDNGKYKDALKISQFELERYLQNDAFLLHDNFDDPILKDAKSFYPQNELLSGQQLYELIRADSLWAFLDPIVERISVDEYLPSGQFL